jgi:hypothetical protein
VHLLRPYGEKLGGNDEEQKDRWTMIEKQCAKKVNLFQDNTGCSFRYGFTFSAKFIYGI